MFADWADAAADALISHADLGAASLHRGVRTGALQRVAHGWYVRTDDLGCAHLPWQRLELALTLRVVAFSRACRGPVIFAGAAAAFTSGLPVFPLTGPIDVLLPYRASPTHVDLPALTGPGGERVGSARVRRSFVGLPPELVSGSAGIRHLEDVANAVWCAGRMPPESAFVTVSATLARHARFDRADPSQSREREDGIRGHLVRSACAHPKWLAIPNRARWVLRNADAGCESPGESRALFALRARGVTGAVTQRPMVVRGHRRFLDIGIDHAGVAGEYEGEAKDGDTPQEIHAAQALRERRDAELQSLGLSVVHIRKGDLSDGDRILADVQSVARRPLAIDPDRALPGLRQRPVPPRGGGR